MGLNSPSGIGTGLLCLFFFAVGVVALLWPERIQGWTLSFYEGAAGLARWNPLLNWMRTSSYLASLRIVGGLSIGAACLILIAAIRGGSS
jgi:hypothetical protein